MDFLWKWVCRCSLFKHGEDSSADIIIPRSPVIPKGRGRTCLCCLVLPITLLVMTDFRNKTFQTTIFIWHMWSVGKRMNKIRGTGTMILHFYPDKVFVHVLFIIKFVVIKVYYSAFLVCLALYPFGIITHCREMIWKDNTRMLLLLKCVWIKNNPKAKGELRFHIHELWEKAYKSSVCWCLHKKSSGCFLFNKSKDWDAFGTKTQRP